MRKGELSEPQREALAKIQRDGVLYPHNGVTTVTIRALAREGLIDVEWLGAVTTYGPSGQTNGARGRRTQEWVARPAADEKKSEGRD